ncbi:MAG: tetratricopeptide repeat protein [Candidatus Omnitrophota bacterium]|jgi:lysophospholipase L1-like esterase
MTSFRDTGCCGFHFLKRSSLLLTHNHSSGDVLGVKNSLGLKISISVFSFILFLCLLEAGLRVVGYFTLRSRDRLRVSSFEKELQERKLLRLEIKTREEETSTLPRPWGGDAEAYSILCVGDSYTYGGAVSFEDTYPSQLQNILDLSGLPRKFKVYNGGICEYNSRQLLNRLPKFINTYRPDAIILLDGASNRYNFALYDMHGNPLLGFIRSLRVYKMFKIVSLNLKDRSFKLRIKQLEKLSHGDIGVKQGEDGYLLRQPSSDWLDAHVASVLSPADVKTPYDEILLRYNQGDIQGALDSCENVLRENPDAADILSIMSYLYSKIDQIDKAKELQDRAFLVSPDSPLVLAYRAYFYENLVIHSVDDKKKSEIIEYCLTAIAADPFYGYPNYWALINIYKLQSRYNARDILGFFDALVQKHPALMDSKLFFNYYNYFRNTKDWEDNIKSWLLADLEKIVNICQKNNINFIIQNYPYDYSVANEALEHTARKFSLTFVDQYSVFQALVTADNYSEYFYDDEHCTKKGHRLMAENVFKVLQARFGAEAQK